MTTPEKNQVVGCLTTTLGELEKVRAAIEGSMVVIKQVGKEIYGLASEERSEFDVRNAYGFCQEVLDELKNHHVCSLTFDLKNENKKLEDRK